METALLYINESLHAAQAASLSSVLILLALFAAFDIGKHSLEPPVFPVSNGDLWNRPELDRVLDTSPLATGLPQGSVPFCSPTIPNPLVLLSLGSANDTQLFFFPSHYLTHRFPLASLLA